jgi:putative addiction module component (TIGR02574 family)
MTETGARLLKDALALPVEERARLAAELMASVDGAPDKDAEAAWAAEIERRESRAIRGKSKGRNWSDAVRDIEKNLPRP